MNPLRLLVLLVSLPLLLGGCGEKESVGKVKEEVKPEEPVAETKPKLEGVNQDELERRGEFPNFIYFIKGSDTPYTGKFYGLYENGKKEIEVNLKDGKQDGLLSLWHENGQKKEEGNYKDGKMDGLWTSWHENGQKKLEGNFEDGEEVSAKYWNSKGEPVDTIEEAEAE